MSLPKEVGSHAEVSKHPIGNGKEETKIEIVLSMFTPDFMSETLTLTFYDAKYEVHIKSFVKVQDP